MKTLKFLLPLLLLGILMVPTFSFAAIQAPDTVSPSVPEPTNMPNLGNVDVNAITKAILNIRNWFAGIILVIAVGVILVGAFLYMTSGGDSEKAKKARGWIVGGIIGIIVAAFAYGIVTIVQNIVSDVIS